jgi:CheY-like chemotaxis protein
MNVKSILLVEDDELDVISLQRVLKKMALDIKLYTAFNGIEALELLRGENKISVPDLILLDLNMPRMNGIEFLEELRKDKCFKNIKVFIMTTSNDEQDRLRTEKYGVSGYIIKPLNFTDNTKKSSSMDYFMHFQMNKILGSD